MATTSPSRLIYSSEVKRSRYFRRFMWLLLGTLAIIGAYVALREAALRSLSDSLLLDIGKAVAIILGGFFAIRGLYNLVLTFIRKSETLRFYNKGFVWSQGNRDYKYKWTELARFREGARGLYVFGRPILQWGAHRLTMDDERVFKFTSVHGDPRTFARIIRPYAAYVMSVKISQTLRQDRPVRLHSRLTVYPGGVEAGKTEIHWSELDATVKNGRLLVRRRERGGFKTIRRYSIHSVDNVGGFLEIVKSTQRQYESQKKVSGSSAVAQNRERRGAAPSGAIPV
jgi:hypothetical protein